MFKIIKQIINLDLLINAIKRDNFNFFFVWHIQNEKNNENIKQKVLKRIKQIEKKRKKMT